MAAHRYWALEVFNDSWALVKDIEMRTTPGGANAATGGTAFGNENLFQSGGVGVAFDGNPSTIWGNPNNGWRLLAYDFTTPVDIVELSISTYQWVSESMRIKLARLLYSDDGVNFRSMAPVITVLNGPDATHVIGGFVEAAASSWVEGRPTRLNSDWPSGPLSARLDLPPARFDLDSGVLAIGGTVSIKDTPTNVPVVRRVRLFEQLTGRVVRETWSNQDGVYLFPKIKSNLYFLVSHDHTLNDNAAVKDRITPQVPT